MARFTESERLEIRQIVHDAMDDYIKDKGLVAKNIITGIAAVLVALAIIGKGVGWALGLIGFSYIGK